MNALGTFIYNKLIGKFNDKFGKTDIEGSSNLLAALGDCFAAATSKDNFNCAKGNKLYYYHEPTYLFEGKDAIPIKTGFRNEWITWRIDGHEETWGPGDLTLLLDAIGVALSKKADEIGYDIRVQQPTRVDWAKKVTQLLCNEYYNLHVVNQLIRGDFKVSVVNNDRKRKRKRINAEQCSLVVGSGMPIYIQKALPPQYSTPADIYYEIQASGNGPKGKDFRQERGKIFEQLTGMSPFKDGQLKNWEQLQRSIVMQWTSGDKIKRGKRPYTALPDLKRHILDAGTASDLHKLIEMMYYNGIIFDSGNAVNSILQMLGIANLNPLWTYPMTYGTVSTYQGITKLDVQLISRDQHRGVKMGRSTRDVSALLTGKADTLTYMVKGVPVEVTPSGSYLYGQPTIRDDQYRNLAQRAYEVNKRHGDVEYQLYVAERDTPASPDDMMIVKGAPSLLGFAIIKHHQKISEANYLRAYPEIQIDRCLFSVKAGKRTYKADDGQIRAFDLHRQAIARKHAAKARYENRKKANEPRNSATPTNGNDDDEMEE